MRRSIRAFAGVIVVAATAQIPTSAALQLHVIRSGGFGAAYDELLPLFERTTGINTVTATGGSQGSGPTTIGAQLRRGVPADVVILSKEGLEELVAEGRIVPNSRVDLAQTPLGLAVRQGAAKPDIASVEGFKRTLLRAKSITFPTLSLIHI